MASCRIGSARLSRPQQPLQALPALLHLLIKLVHRVLFPVGFARGEPVAEGIGFAEGGQGAGAAEGEGDEVDVTEIEPAMARPPEAARLFGDDDGLGGADGEIEELAAFAQALEEDGEQGGFAGLPLVRSVTLPAARKPCQSQETWSGSSSS
jgi:hypothetical protein